MKKITTLLLAIAFVAISANAAVTINVRTTTGDAPYLYAWNGTTGTNFTTSGTWPDDPITLIGNTTDGNPVYQWIGPDIVEGDSPTGIIFNNGSTQTSDLDYVAGGVYNLAGKLLYTVPNSGGGGIELLEPVITDNYIKFEGIKSDGNYRFILDTYEWEKDHGPQFQLKIEPIDPSKPAYFSQSDLSDPNYWEPMFMAVTQQMAGEAMTAQDNIKRLYLGDVQLLENQFIDYDEFHIVGFDLKNDYTLPSGCLLNAGQHMDEMDVKCEGTMTLSPNSLPADKMFYVTVYTQPVYDVWNNYKQSYNCQYILNMEGNAPAITAVKVTSKVDNDVFTEQLPATGFDDVIIEAPINYFYLNRFEVDVNVDVDEIFMDYAIVKGNDAPNGWTSIHATKTEDGKWIADNINLNILEGLESGQNYTLMFDFISGYVDEVGDRLRYDNGGIMYRVNFVCGNSSPKPGDVNGDGIVSSVDVTVLYNYLLNDDSSDIVNGDQDGDGIITSVDITIIYNILLGD